MCVCVCVCVCVCTHIYELLISHKKNWKFCHLFIDLKVVSPKVWTCPLINKCLSNVSTVINLCVYVLGFGSQQFAFQTEEEMKLWLRALSAEQQHSTAKAQCLGSIGPYWFQFLILSQEIKEQVANSRFVTILMPEHSRQLNRIKLGGNWKIKTTN